MNNNPGQFNNLPLMTRRTVRHHDDAGYLAVVQVVSELLDQDFTPRPYPGSYSWQGTGTETLWKICYYRNSMAFGIRLPWAERFPSLQELTFWDRRFEVLPNPGIYFVGFGVTSDEFALARIRQAIRAVYHDASTGGW